MGKNSRRRPQEYQGKIGLITDSRAALTYLKDLSDTFDREASLLKPNGNFLFDFLNAKIVDERGRTLDPKEWLGDIKGMTLVNDYDGGYHMKRTEGPLSVPALEVKRFVPGKPPIRVYVYRKAR